MLWLMNNDEVDSPPPYTQNQEDWRFNVYLISVISSNMTFLHDIC